MAAINGDLRDLSSEDLDAVSGGFFSLFLRFPQAATGGGGGPTNDPAAQFQAIMEQLTGGQ